MDITDQPLGQKPIQVVDGKSISVACCGASVGWVDVSQAQKKSLWVGPSNPTAFIAIATLGRAPFAAVVDAQGKIAGLNNTIVSKTGTARLEAIAAYINSKLAKFYWAIELRTAVVEGFWSTLYPRTFEALPWPKNLLPEQEQQLADGYDRLAELAARAKNNPNEWLLAEAKRRIEQGYLSLADPSLGLRFPGGAVEARTGELALDGTRIKNGLLTFAEFADTDIAEYIYRLLALTTDEETLLGTAAVQKLLVPRDYAALMQEYRRRWDAFQRVEQDFFAALETVDQAVYDAFGLTEPERAYVEARLAAFPLNRLTPRYPWDVVRPRPIRAYMQDRFA